MKKQADKLTTTAPTMLGLRTCKKDGTSYKGFKWPLTVGAEVEAPDWSARAECGHGLHFLPWGEGDGGLLNWDDEAVALVIEPLGPVVDIDGAKSKTSKARVIFVGAHHEAAQFIADHGGVGKSIAGAVVAKGRYQGATAGYRGQATAGDSGQATAGYRGQATAGYRGLATAGDSGLATAGYRGLIIISRWDEKADRRRAHVGYIGETLDIAGNPLQPGTYYRLDDEGGFVEVAS